MSGKPRNLSYNSVAPLSKDLEFGSTSCRLEVGTFLDLSSASIEMATESKVAAEDAKIDLFEDDDEFEEFEIGEEWDDKEEGSEAVQQWEDDWDDDDVNDDFSVQLRRELEISTEKN